MEEQVDAPDDAEDSPEGLRRLRLLLVAALALPLALSASLPLL